MRSIKLILICVLLNCVAAGAFAQAPLPDSRERERQRLVLYAVSTVKEVAADAPLWNDKETSVSVLTDSADLLWNDEPVQAVKWIRKAWDIANQASAQPADDKLKAFFTHSTQSHLRTMVLTTARKHDPKLVEELLKQISARNSDEKTERGAFDDRTARSEQLLSMAQQLVDSDPQQAFALAQESLSDGLSYKLQGILTSLRVKNAPLANSLFDLALIRFGTVVPDPSEAQVLAGYLFQPGLTLSANSAGRGILVVNPSQQNFAIVASTEPERAKRYLTVLYQRLLVQPISIETPEGKQRAQQLLILGNLVARQYLIFAPDLAPAAQGFLVQLQRQLGSDRDAGPSGEQPPREADATGSTKNLTAEERYGKRIDELVALAEKEPNTLFRDVAYSKAAIATNPDDYERARRIAEKIDDNDLRTDAISFVHYRAALFFVSKADVVKATDLDAAIRDPARRAVVKIAIAQRLLLSIKGKASESTELEMRIMNLMNEVDRSFKTADASANGAKILLAKTAILSKLEPIQAFAGLAEAVHMINKLERFDLRSSAAPNLGMGAVSISGATVISPRAGFDFHSAIDSLIDTDFEQVIAISGTLATKEQSGRARVEAAKLYLLKNRNSTGKESISATH